MACAVSKKYKKYFTSDIIRNIARSKISANDVEVEHLVKSFMYYRGMNRKRFISAFKKLKVLVLSTLSKLLDTTDSDDDAYEIILGP